MQSARVYVMGKTHLLDASSALKIRVFDEVEQQTVGDIDEAVDGVVKYFLFFHKGIFRK
jgi:hypothetical protein